MDLDNLPVGATKREAVQNMFDRIAPRYDLLNRLLTFGMDQLWRRRSLSIIGVGASDTVVDIACGTGDFAELARARGAQVVGIDFAFEMLLGARRRDIDAGFVQGDALNLPLPDRCATAVTCGFALRNFVSLDPVFQEMARVLQPGGRIALLEVYEPQNPLLRALHCLHFKKLVPLVGGLLSDRTAYRYLPKSVAYLPPDAQLFASLERAGFKDVKRKKFFFGAAQLLTGVLR